MAIKIKTRGPKKTKGAISIEYYIPIAIVIFASLTLLIQDETIRLAGHYADHYSEYVTAHDWIGNSALQTK